MPINAFWLLSSQITRLRAETDLRSLNIGAAVQSADGFKQLQEALTEEVGFVMTQQPRAIAHAVRDKEGFEQLRAMAGG